MTGLSLAITASALAPRRAFTSADNRFRIRRSASLPGLVSSLPGNGGSRSPGSPPLAQVGDAGLGLVEGQAPELQPPDEPLLDVLGLLTLIAARVTLTWLPAWLGFPEQRRNFR